MPIFDRGHTYVTGEDATEAIFNDPWDALELFLNVTKLDGLNIQPDSIGPTELAPGIEAALPAAIVTALPGSPVDGQIIYYQNAAMATAGIVWQLRYNAALSGSKWQFIGGAPYRVGSDPTMGPTNSTSWVPDGSGFLLTVPIAGEYRVELSAAVSHTSGGPTYFGLAVNDAVTEDGLNPAHGDVVTLNGAAAESAYLDRKKTLTAGQTLKRAHKSASGAVPLSSLNCMIALTPERVG